MKRLILTVVWEALGLALLLAFVVALATMPPLQVHSSPTAALGFQLKVDTQKWRATAVEYEQTIAAGTLGRDRGGNPVAQLLAARMGNSLKLVGISLVLALFLGAAKGIWDFNQMRLGKIAIGPAITGVVQGLPDFWLVLMIQVAAVYLFQHLGWRPFPPIWDDAYPVSSMVYPVFCLSLIPLAYVARITNTALTSVYDLEYVRTARAKGLSEGAVIWRHALRSAVVQILDGLPNALAVMFSNLLIVEYLFRFPGVTILLKDAAAPINAVDPRVTPPPPDVPVLVAAGVSLGLIFAVLYLVISILRRFFDPRLREREEA